MAPPCGFDDCRDSQQWHALFAVLAGCRRPGTGSRAHHFLGVVRSIHELVAYQVQDEAS